MPGIHHCMCSSTPTAPPLSFSPPLPVLFLKFCRTDSNSLNTHTPDPHFSLSGSSFAAPPRIPCLGLHRSGSSVLNVLPRLHRPTSGTLTLQHHEKQNAGIRVWLEGGGRALTKSGFWWQWVLRVHQSLEIEREFKADVDPFLMTSFCQSCLPCAPFYH